MEDDLATFARTSRSAIHTTAEERSSADSEVGWGRRWRPRPWLPSLARLVYRMLRYGMKYVDQGAEFYEAQYRKQQVSYPQAPSHPARIANHRTCGSGLKQE